MKGVETLFVYDIVQQWREMTGLPAVLAIWVARRGVVTPEMAGGFSGFARIRDGTHWRDRRGRGAEAGICRPANWSATSTENIDFSLDDENLAGLKHYYEECARAGLIPEARELEFAERRNRRQARVAPAFRRAFARF